MTDTDREQEQQKLASDTEPDAARILGDCLKSSFTAENHESLGNDLMRLLLHLSHE